MHSRTLLMTYLLQLMQARHLKQVEAAEWFGVSQSRISHLVNERIDRFTVDMLINMLASAGVQVKISFAARRAETGPRGNPTGWYEHGKVVTAAAVLQPAPWDQDDTKSAFFVLSSFRGEHAEATESPGAAWSATKTWW
jgi:predicted XRE-type DNA-binding protein